MEAFFQLMTEYADPLRSLTAIGTLVLSVASIFIAVTTFRSQRKHNVNSVRPLAFLWLLDSEGEVSIMLQNNGVGPLLIDDVHVTTNSNGHMYGNLITPMPSLPGKLSYDYYIGVPAGWSIIPGSEIALFKFTGNENDELFVEYREKVREVLSGVNIEVQYRDIFKRKMPVYDRNLDWYARTK
jgi:hypothetical protein